jgi:hypothetical protein
MVDALYRASRWVGPSLGSVIDLRPAAGIPQVELGLADGATMPVGGLVVDEERSVRHANADAALRAALTRGFLSLENEAEFSFYRYPESPDDLRDYLAVKCRHTRLDAATHARSGALLRQYPEGKLWLREQVVIRLLRPTRSPDRRIESVSR